MPDQGHSIDAYLNRVRVGLRGLSSEDINEIIAELRSHISDKVAGGEEGGGDAVLSALGSPEELADQYITDHMLAQANVSRSPFRLLHSLSRWASLSRAGFFVLMFSVMGYFLGGLFALWAVLKPLHPQTAGLWISRDNTGDLAISLRLGFGNVPTVGREVLGWWVIPLGLVVGCGLIILTTRLAIWCAREYRRKNMLPKTSFLLSQQE
jgi:hypothetical protein